MLLSLHFHDYSRGHLRRVISAGGVQIDEHGGKPAYRVRAGQRVRIVLPEIPRQAPRPEEIPLEILFEDEDLVVVNKPPGMVVHPARGHWSGTLASALQFHFGPRLSSSGGPLRPGIVHRLDRDTSGAILVARHDQAHADWPSSSNRARSRRSTSPWSSARRTWTATSSTARSPSIRCTARRWPRSATMTKAARRRRSTGGGAVSRFCGGAGDAQDGPHAPDPRAPGPYRSAGALRSGVWHRAELTRGEIRGDSGDTTVLLDRQALHARRLRFLHPRTGEPLEIEAPLPADMAAVLARAAEVSHVVASSGTGS